MNPVDSHIDVPLSYCNSDCICDKNQWEPVCGENGVTYISPCLAGCKSFRGDKKLMNIVSISFHFLTSPCSQLHIQFHTYFLHLCKSKVSSKRYKNGSYVIFSC
jgi:hypothetical protein